ncbi:unnamed protein product [Thelazia callipaeda]|uniref:BRCA2 n=1 Tax=Thelazia callipaeda TaxID=103827 RepID=A0A0N5D6K5_THECL|nr:unnamed protein product [Thelazia callipaeda]
MCLGIETFTSSTNNINLLSKYKKEETPLIGKNREQISQTKTKLNTSTMKERTMNCIPQITDEAEIRSSDSLSLKKPEIKFAKPDDLPPPAKTMEDVQFSDFTEAAVQSTKQSTKAASILPTTYQATQKSTRHMKLQKKTVTKISKASAHEDQSLPENRRVYPTTLA